MTTPPPEDTTVMDTQLTLALPGISITPTGLEAGATLTATQAMAALRAIRPVGAAWRWAVGDLVLATVDGDLTRLDEAWRLVADLDLDNRADLSHTVWTAARIRPEQRHPDLSWTHHQIVARLVDPADDEALVGWLNRAEEEGWTSHDLEQRIRRARESAEQRPLPGTTAWATEHKQVIAAVNKLFARDPDAAVLLRGDGTWEVVQ